MKAILIAAIAAITLTGCTDEDGARHALDVSGYTSIEIKGYGWTGCGKDDSFHTRFSAIGPSGKPVEGVVCSGFFKGGTIRVW